jgi:hypothetical protein
MQCGHERGSGGAVAGGDSALGVRGVCRIVPTHSPRLVPGERGTRADAPHAQAAGGQVGAATCAGQQRQFDVFRTEYNTERPHNALGGDTPGSRYAPSRRPYPERLPTPEYPGIFW